MKVVDMFEPEVSVTDMFRKDHAEMVADAPDLEAYAVLFMAADGSVSRKWYASRPLTLLGLVGALHETAHAILDEREIIAELEAD